MHFGGDVLFADVSLEVERGDKIGVVGPNGSGKSTLLKMMAGLMEARGGRVVHAPSVRVAYQAQELDLEPEESVFAQLRAGFAKDLARGERLRELGELMAAAEGEDAQRALLAEYERLQSDHEAAGGYDVDRRIERVLSSLGLAEEAWHQPVKLFSGGERNVLGLARALLAEPDVLLLDEPSNHLDMEGTEWFATFVRHCSAAVVMVSHNRYLLDDCADTIWEVRGPRVTSWTGNYTSFREQRALADARQERLHRTQQREIERLEFQARRLKDMANAYDDPKQAKRAKAMERRIDRMDRIESVDNNVRKLGARLGGAGRHGRIALRVTDFDFAYGDRVLFEGANLDIEFGEHVALVGPNGCGKTTLISAILAHGAWENDTLRLGKAVRVGQYSQLHEEALEASATLVRWVAGDTGLPRRAAADLLHRFGFSHDDLDRPIRTLSGGEKSRLQLARLTHQDVNLLVLDEPTNHLDIEACEQLEETLLAFQGTLLVISHDRYFLERLVTRVVEVHDRGLVSHEHGFAEWWERHKAQVASGGVVRRGALELRSRRGAAEEAGGGARNEREERKERQRDLRRLQTEMRGLETKIASDEERKTELEAAVTLAYSPDGDTACVDIDRGAQLAAELAELAELSARLGALYARWEAAGEEAEALGEP